MAIGLSSFKKKYLFGTGNLERLRGIVLGNERITAVSLAELELDDEQIQIEGFYQPLSTHSCAAAST